MVSLGENGTLPDETYGGILVGFTKCRNEDFKAVFQQLTQEWHDHFSSCFPFTTSFCGSSYSKTTIANIKHILCDANDLYSNFTTSNKWVAHNHVSACFNCGGDCGCNHCKEHCDQICIVQNKAKFQEEKNCQWSDCCRCSCGGQNHQGSWNNEWNKPGVANFICVANGGVHCFDEVWIAYYCGNL